MWSDRVRLMMLLQTVLLIGVICAVESALQASPSTPATASSNHEGDDLIKIYKRIIPADVLRGKFH